MTEVRGVETARGPGARGRGRPTIATEATWARFPHRPCGTRDDHRGPRTVRATLGRRPDRSRPRHRGPPRGARRRCDPRCARAVPADDHRMGTVRRMRRGCAFRFADHDGVREGTASRARGGSPLPFDDPRPRRPLVHSGSGRAPSSLTCVDPAARRPPPEVVRAFGLTGRPRRLRDGQGTTFAAGHGVLKPAGADAAWIAETMADLVEDGFRVPRPLRAGARWVVDGWAAWTRVEGRHRSRDTPWTAALDVAHRVEAALSPVAAPRRPHRPLGRGGPGGVG